MSRRGEDAQSEPPGPWLGQPGSPGHLMMPSLRSWSVGAAKTEAASAMRRIAIFVMLKGLERAILKLESGMSMRLGQVDEDGQGTKEHDDRQSFIHVLTHRSWTASPVCSPRTDELSPR